MSESKPKTAEEVFAAFLALSAEEQEKLLLMVNNSEHSGWASPEIKQAWIDECDRRMQLIDEGKMKLVPSQEVHRRLAKIIAK